MGEDSYRTSDGHGWEESGDWHSYAHCLCSLCGEVEEKHAEETRS